MPRPPGSGSGLGFCRSYSFNAGDLVTCGDVLVNYLEAYNAIPWDDLRYMFGEVGRGAGAGRGSWGWLAQPRGTWQWRQPRASGPWAVCLVCV